MGVNTSFESPLRYKADGS